MTPLPRQCFNFFFSETVVFICEAGASSGARDPQKELMGGN